MTRQQRFTRKLIYLVIIFGLLMTLYYLGHPSTRSAEGEAGSPGGVLAQMRTEEKLDQTQLGQIDPASETLRLAMFGFRGIAANLLGLKAIDYQRTKDWSNLSATLNQIIKIQPNFLKVWDHQAWNLSYNCSAEFDGYKDRYSWVVKGLDFLKKGIEYNENEPLLIRSMGRITSQKIGRSDEKKQFRRLFIADDDYHGSRPKSERDNWLLGKQWYLNAHELVRNKGAIRTGTSPLLFYSEPPMCQMQYGSALAEEGVFGEKAKKAWSDASDDWIQYGERDIPTPSGAFIRLGDIERLHKEYSKLINELDKLAGGAREKLYKRKYEQLTKAQIMAIKVPEKLQNKDQKALAYEAKELLTVTPDEIARQATGANRNKANKLLEKIEYIDMDIKRIKRNQGVVNYDYWDLRAKVEQTDKMLEARQSTFEADKAMRQGNLPKANQDYLHAAEVWNLVLRESPGILSDKATEDDIDHLLKQYSKTLEQTDELYPDNFPLTWFVSFVVDHNDKMSRLIQAVNRGDESFNAGNYPEAQERYSRAIELWKLILAENTSMYQMSDPNTGSRILALVRRYAKTLKLMGMPFPDRFALRGFVWMQVEHSQTMRTIEGAVQEAHQLQSENKLPAAEKEMDKAIFAWESLLERYPSLIGDKSICNKIIEQMGLYRKILEAQNRPLPDPFPLQEVLDRYGSSK
jgi:hypothetical protein